MQSNVARSYFGLFLNEIKCQSISAIQLRTKEVAFYFTVTSFELLKNLLKQLNINHKLHHQNGSCILTTTDSSLIALAQVHAIYMLERSKHAKHCLTGKSEDKFWFNEKTYDHRAEGELDQFGVRVVEIKKKEFTLQGV